MLGIKLRTFEILMDQRYIYIPLVSVVAIIIALI